MYYDRTTKIENGIPETHTFWTNTGCSKKGFGRPLKLVCDLWLGIPRLVVRGWNLLMETKNWHEQLGVLWGCIKALETQLRIFFDAYDGAIRDGTFHPDYSNISVGTLVPQCRLTKFSYFDKLLHEYNGVVSAARSQIEKATEISNLRNALAHGTVFISSDDRPYRHLLNFKAVNDSTTEVSFAAYMSPDWFDTQQHLILDAVQKVMSETRRHR